MFEKLKKNYSHRSFSTNDARELGVTQRMLTYLIKSGKIKRIARGLYTLVGVDVSGKDWQFHDLAVEASSYKKSVICLVSALNYWEITEEFTRSFWLAFSNNHPPVKNPMVRMYRPRNLELGVISIRLSGIEVKITDPERSLVDAFKQLDEESAVASLRMYLGQEDSKINIAKLVNYATQLKETKILKILNNVVSARARSYPTLKEKTFRDTVKVISKIRK